MQGKYRFRSVLYPRKIGRVRAAALILAALAVGLLLSACGGGGNGELLPGATADQITSNLDQVQASYESGDCEKAENAVAQVSTEVDDLNRVDVELKKALKNGALKLSEVVNNCGAAEEAEEAKAEEKAEEEEQAQIEGEEAEAEEEAFLEEQKEEERDLKAEEKAEKEEEKAEPPTGGEESPKGEAKGLEKQEEETVPPPTEEPEELTPPAAGGGPAGGVGPGAAVEGGE
jgi:membrane protein involved in colicin uptake